MNMTVYAVPCVIAFRLCIAFFADCMPGVHGSVPQLCLLVRAWHLPAMCWPPIRMSHLSQASSEKDYCIPVIYSNFSWIRESIFTQIFSVLQVCHILIVAGVMCRYIIIFSILYLDVFVYILGLSEELQPLILYAHHYNCNTHVCVLRYHLKCAICRCISSLIVHDSFYKI